MVDRNTGRKTIGFTMGAKKKSIDKSVYEQDTK